MLALSITLPFGLAASAADSPSQPAPTDSRPTPFPRGELIQRLPRGTEIGPGWQEHLDLLVDPRSQPSEYFPPSVPPATIALLKQRIRGEGTCQMRYTHDGSTEFEAWLTRLRDPDSVAAERRRLLETPVAANDPGFRRRTTRIDSLEALILEGRDGSTVWIGANSLMLSLNLPLRKEVSGEFLKTAAVFVRRLTAPTPADPKAPAKDSAAASGSPSPAAPRQRVVHAMGDLYVTVEDGSSETVHLSAPCRENADSACYFTVTNAGVEPILVWNVRLQTRSKPDGSDEASWTTIHSDYPSSVANLAPGTSQVERVVPPDHATWRLCLLYTKPPASPSAREFELVSAPIPHVAP